MELHTIITLKNKGLSNREIHRQTGIDRKTIARHWSRYLEECSKLSDGLNARLSQEAITNPPRYDSSKRQPVKYTPEIDAALDEILDGEKQKLKDLGLTNKQMLTNRQIHALLVGQGFDIGNTTVTNNVKVKRRRKREAFIRQEYDLGQRLEYDFGEARLVVGGTSDTYHMATIAAPASRFRWAYLYKNQKKEVFIDSHIRFFEMVGGVYREVVYDNMKNVVHRFIGRNEKELNTDLVKMSMYYGFAINVTNCYSGNEKGYVEGSVKVVRNEVFATRYKFDTFEEASDYLQTRLTELNATSDIEVEKACLMDAKPKLEIAQISTGNVDKYSFVRIDNNFYSVPDYLVGYELTIKSYPFEIEIYSGFEHVCTHKRLEGYHQMSVDIFHYLDTLAKKPGALKNSKALRCRSGLKTIFNDHFSGREREFIRLLADNADKPIEDVLAACTLEAKDTSKYSNADTKTMSKELQATTRNNLAALSATFLKGGERIAC